MTDSTTSNRITLLKKCLTLAESLETQPEAKQQFQTLYDTLLTENPQIAELVEMLWLEVLAARRSAAFWQQLSEFEKTMADQMLQSLTQTRQNYLRLMQEM